MNEAGRAVGACADGLAVDPTLLGDGRACPPLPPQPQTNLVLSNGLSSAGGLSLAREGPGQDNSSDPQGGGSEEEPAVCDSGPRKEELVGDVEVAGGWRVSGIGQDQHCHGDSNESQGT